MSTTVSVVIPAYNAAAWIAETLDSVLAQQCADLEVIVVDDGSTDETAAVVACYPQVRYLCKPNGGQASARNAGIRAACGEYIAFVDADDLWLPEKLRLQLALLRQSGRHWVYCDGYGFDDRTGRVRFRFDKRSRLYEGDVLERIFVSNFIESPTPVVRRTVFDEVGYFDESALLRKREDWDMWIRIAARYPVALVRLPLVRYRVHTTSGTGGEDQAFTFASQLAVIDRAAARDPQRLAHLRHQSIKELCYRVGRRLTAQGELATARKLFVLAARLVPGDARSYLYWLGCLAGGPALRTAIQVRRWLQQ